MSLVVVLPSTNPGNAICSAFCNLTGQEMTLALLLPTPHSEICIEGLFLWVGDLFELASLPWTY